MQTRYCIFADGLFVRPTHPFELVESPGERLFLPGLERTASALSEIEEAYPLRDICVCADYGQRHERYIYCRPSGGKSRRLIRRPGDPVCYSISGWLQTLCGAEQPAAQYRVSEPGAVACQHCRRLMSMHWHVRRLMQHRLAAQAPAAYRAILTQVMCDA